MAEDGFWLDVERQRHITDLRSQVERLTKERDAAVAREQGEAVKVFILKEQIKGPKGYETWYEAAVDERKQRTDLAARLQQAEAAVARLREALGKHGRHLNIACTRHFHAYRPEDCVCGLAAALAQGKEEPANGG